MEPQIYVLWFDAASRINRQPGTKLPATTSSSRSKQNGRGAGGQVVEYGAKKPLFPAGCDHNAPTAFSSFCWSHASCILVVHAATTVPKMLQVRLDYLLPWGIGNSFPNSSACFL
jgi:hypothetical protein